MENGEDILEEEGTTRGGLKALDKILCAQFGGTLMTEEQLDKATAEAEKEAERILQTPLFVKK